MSGAGESWPEARAFPRVEYPSHLRPYLQVAGETCEVVDCSEQGLRYGSAVDPRPVGSMVNGRIRFRSGVEVAVRGRVVRVQGGEVLEVGAQPRAKALRLADVDHAPVLIPEPVHAR